MPPNSTRASAMSDLFGAIAERRILAGAGDDDGGSSKGRRACCASDRAPTQNLAPLVGETGIRALLARSVALSSETFPGSPAPSRLSD